MSLNLFGFLNTPPPQATPPTPPQREVLNTAKQQFPTLVRIAQAATPILMQYPLTAMPLGCALTTLHAVSALRSSSPQDYTLCALTLSSLAIGFFFSALLPAVLLLQSLSSEIAAGVHQLKKGNIPLTLHHVANSVVSVLRLSLHHRFSLDLAIATTAIRLASDLSRVLQEAKACWKREDRSIELIGSTIMLMLGSQRLHLQVAQKQMRITDSIISEMDESLNGKGLSKRKYSDAQLREIRKALKDKDQKVRVASYNVLFDLMDDKLKAEEQMHSWENRHERVDRLIKHIDPDILCVQETYPEQIKKLQELFQGKLECFQGKREQGEINAIFYNPKRFTVQESSSWAFDLPLGSDPSKSSLPLELEPGTAGTLATFFDKTSQGVFSVINTHLTFQRLNARELQARYIAELARAQQEKGIPTIFTGDLNTFPHNHSAQVPFYDGTRVENILEETLRDTEKRALLGHFGAQATGVVNFIRSFWDHSALSKEAMRGPKVTMDHAYVTPDVTVLTHAVDAALVGKLLPSDHLPLITDIIIRGAVRN